MVNISKTRSMVYIKDNYGVFDYCLFKCILPVVQVQYGGSLINFITNCVIVVRRRWLRLILTSSAIGR